MKVRNARSYIPYAVTTPSLTIGYSGGYDAQLIPPGGIVLTETGRNNLHHYSLSRKRAATIWGHRPASSDSPEMSERIDVSLYNHVLSHELRTDNGAWALEIRESVRRGDQWFYITDEIRIVSSREAHRWLAKNGLNDTIGEHFQKTNHLSRHRINFNHHVNVIKHRRRISVVWNLFLILMGLTIIAVYLKPLVDRVLAME